VCYNSTYNTSNNSSILSRYVRGSTCCFIRPSKEARAVCAPFSLVGGTCVALYRGRQRIVRSFVFHLSLSAPMAPSCSMIAMACSIIFTSPSRLRCCIGYGSWLVVLFIAARGARRNDDSVRVLVVTALLHASV
jgi:hypothetical protein